ncbi:MAG: dihydroorotase [bacterium]|nr:dihydroorotase [bacterium]MDY5826682.1 dihydroorotase [Candidatus Limisoma sp.]
MTKRIIYNGDIANEGKVARGYVVIDDDKIAAVGEGAPSSGLLSECDEKEDVDGALVMPGVIDDQVHFRDPGLTHKADISTESAAAVAGGVTSYMDMPNTIPPTTTLAALEAKNRRASEVSLANYGFFIGATNENISTLQAVDYSYTPGVKLFLGASTGNMLVNERDALRAIFAEVPAIIAIHSEDEALIRRNRDFYVKKYGDELPVKFHPLIRSTEVCYKSTARAVEWAEKYGTRLHVLHVSTARELELFSNAPLAQKRITSEVCVHHLWFSDEDYARLGNLIKWNPAVKTWDDRAALRTALERDYIDIVATDHAPHLLSEKQGSCLKAASGGPLVQHSLLVMLELVDKGVFTLDTVVRKMCHAPADLFGVVKRGYLREGYYADIVVVDRNVPFAVRSENILTKCGWSPFEGYTFRNSIRQTYVNGQLAYNQGSINSVVRGRRLKFNNSK